MEAQANLRSAPDQETPPRARDEAGDAMVILEDIIMKFGPRTVLDRLSLSVPQGRTTVVMGGSGHGKSTILKLIVGFMRPNAGRIFIDGQAEGPY